MYRQIVFRLAIILTAIAVVSGDLSAVTTTKAGAKKKTAAKKKPVVAAKKTTATTRTVAAVRTTRSSSAVKPMTFNHTPTTRVRIPGGPWREPNFADSTDGDRMEGEDLRVRKAATEALGPMNGTIVVTDPYTGRVLTIVNQKTALKSGFQPCSTIKVVAALAALSEGIIERTTILRTSGRRMDLTYALAKSDNPFFAALGRKLGFDRASYYARLFGLGERAGLNIDGEQPGILPDSPPEGGVGMMTSFGSGISLTPLELAALLGSIANGGTLYYLQYPRSPEEIQNFIPRVKRNLDVQQWLPEVKPGMMGAVEFGTARRANYDPTEPIFGKTGTCTDSRSPVHLGWFGSYNEIGKNKLVVVVLLTGGKLVNGPAAAGVAGKVYHNLSLQNYFAEARTPITPAALVATQACCR